ncbi:MAG: type II and III secretion system protein family protein [Planctomycetaceae bacterium]|nr:type II and III secretion system protein family protein [Planctomycetaceae bacterium]
MCTRLLSQRLLPFVLSWLFPLVVLAQQATTLPPKPSVVYKVQYANDRLEMTVHSSRILTLDRKIAQAQVNNPEVLELTPITPNQVQVSAKSNGVTQLNIWDDEKRLYTIDVIIHGDAKELELVLQSTFPHAALRITPVANSVLISGYVDQPEQVERIIRIAEEYYPKVINNMKVGGCQQVLLHVKVMEVSRTKLRRLGFDWGKITGSNTLVSSPSGLMSDVSSGSSATTGVFRTQAPGTFAFGILNGSSGFYGVLDALRQDDLMKILSEPTLVAVNGEKASFNQGGQIPVPEPQSLGTISISWKTYGTQVRFVPVVLGNGKIRLDVWPEISELDETRSFNINGTQVPSIKNRDVHTTVEMGAGQTLAIAGLVQTVVEAENGGLPWIGDVPYLGAAFRHVKESRNEIELLIMVTPELVEAMDPNEVPHCGPGTQTTSPSDWELFMKGYLEVPNCCAGGQGGPGDGTPQDGMVGPDEQVPAPAPDASGNSGDGSGRPPAAAMARRRSNSSYNRYSQTKASLAGSPNNPPGFMGPVGYDVVK